MHIVKQIQQSEPKFETDDNIAELTALFRWKEIFEFVNLNVPDTVT